MAGVGKRAASSGPLHYAMTPELAANETAEQDDEDACWGGESAWVAQDAEAGLPPGLSFGPWSQPPP